MENTKELFTTYVLHSEKFMKHYTGYTSDLQSRLLSHQELGNKDWTTKYRPWKLIFTKEFTNYCFINLLVKNEFLLLMLTIYIPFDKFAQSILESVEIFE